MRVSINTDWLKWKDPLENITRKNINIGHHDT